MTSWKVAAKTVFKNAANTVIKNNKFQSPQGIIFYLTSDETQSPGRTILLTDFLILSIQVNLVFHYLKLLCQSDIVFFFQKVILFFFLALEYFYLFIYH